VDDLLADTVVRGQALVGDVATGISSAHLYDHVGCQLRLTVPLSPRNAFGPRAGKVTVPRGHIAHVFCLRAFDHVCRPVFVWPSFDARRIVAAMQRARFRPAAVGQEKRNPVRHLDASRPVSHRTHTRLPIAQAPAAGRPQPTWPERGPYNRTAFCYVPPEALMKW
jgi:hypothetical protein